MPWFGMDIGGTLTKLVYFEPNEDEPERDQQTDVLKKIRHYLTKNSAYGKVSLTICDNRYTYSKYLHFRLVTEVSFNTRCQLPWLDQLDS